MRALTAAELAISAQLFACDPPDLTLVKVETRSDRVRRLCQADPAHVAGFINALIDRLEVLESTVSGLSAREQL